MGRPIEVTRLEHSATALRELAAKTHDGAVAGRLLRIALILEGHFDCSVQLARDCFFPLAMTVRESARLPRSGPAGYRHGAI